MTLKHIVVDQNVLRKESLLQPAIEQAKSNNEFIILTDIALAEMMKAEQWEYTTRRSLKILSELPEIVAVAAAIGPLMKLELDHGKACTDIVDGEVSSALRNLLDEFRTSDGPTLAHIKTAIDDARQLAGSQHFDHDRNKQRLAQVVRGCKESLSAEEIKAVRRGDEAKIQQFLAGWSMTRTCRDGLVGAGYPELLANQLATQPSVSGHEFYAMVSLALRWMDSLDGAEAAKVTNDLADQDYIVTATFCRDIVSEENRVRQMYSRLKSVIDAREQMLATEFHKSTGTD